MKLISLALLAAILTGCATSSPTQYSDGKPVPSERILVRLEKPKGPSARVIIVRDSGLLGSGCSFGLFLDGTQIANMDTGEILALDIDPGEHILGTARVGRALCAGEDERQENTTLLKTGDTKYFRVVARMDVGATIQPTTMVQAPSLK